MSYRNLLIGLFFLQCLSVAHAMDTVNLTPEQAWQKAECLKFHLFKAMEARKPEDVSALLAEGASPNDQYDFTSPLFMALFGCGRDAKALKIAEHLLQRGANPNEQYNWVPLLVQAASHGWWDVMELLLRYKATIDAQAYVHGKTALHVATEGGFWIVVSNLLDKGADSSIKDGEGRTALQIAKEKGDAVIINILENCSAQR